MKMLNRFFITLLIVGAVVFHALWTTHHPIFFTQDEEVLVTLGSVVIKSDMKRDEAPFEFIGNYMQKYRMDLWPEYLRREVIRDLERN